MKRHTRWLRRLVGMVGIPLLVLQSGCLRSFNPVHAPPPEHTACCAEVPQCARNHVYIFIVHGVDPLDCANLKGLRDYVQSLGFIKTYYGQLYHSSYFAKEIRRIHQEDPDARFVLAGFSFGANSVRDLAHAVEPDGVPIDLLVYLGGNTLKNVPEDRPANATRIINILATGCIWNGDTLDDAVNLNYPDVYHFGSPTHVQTLCLLATELTEVAARVPIVEWQLPPLEEEAPTPRPLAPATTESQTEDEWDFLKPRTGQVRHTQP
jgi:hypothetical protein